MKNLRVLICDSSIDGTWIAVGLENHIVIQGKDPTVLVKNWLSQYVGTQILRKTYNSAFRNFIAPDRFHSMWSKALNDKMTLQQTINLRELNMGGEKDGLRYDHDQLDLADTATFILYNEIKDTI